MCRGVRVYDYECDVVVSKDRVMDGCWLGHSCVPCVPLAFATDFLEVSFSFFVGGEEERGLLLESLTKSAPNRQRWGHVRHKRAFTDTTHNMCIKKDKNNKREKEDKRIQHCEMNCTSQALPQNAVESCPIAFSRVDWLL